MHNDALLHFDAHWCNCKKHNENNNVKWKSKKIEIVPTNWKVIFQIPDTKMLLLSITDEHDLIDMIDLID